MGDGLVRARAARRIEFQGLPVEVEWAEGETRSGVAPDGTRWEREMRADYGFVPDTSAKGDGEPLDVYVGRDPGAPDAYLVEQLKPDGRFDEFKAILGEPSAAAALDLYLAHYPAGWEANVGQVWAMPVSRLRELAAEASL